MRFSTFGGCVLFLFGLTAVSGGDDTPPPPAPRSVTLDVVVASGPQGAAGGEMTAAALAELEKAGKLQWLIRTRLTTIENEKAVVRVSEHAPLVTSRVSRGGFGGEGSQNLTTLVNVGTTVEAMAQVADDNSIVVNLSAEKSWLEPASPPAEGGEGPPATLPAQRTNTLTSKSTVRVQPGEPTLVAAQSSSGGSGKIQTWIMLTASASAPPARAAAADNASLELKVFQLRFAAAADLAKVLSSALAKERLRIAVDERTNSILAHGPPESLEIVQALLTRLDQEVPGK